MDEQSSHSAAVVVSNDDLLIEILLWLPVISVRWFKSVSRQWRSLLSHPTFTRRYDTRHYRKSPLGLFNSDNNEYVPFDDEDQTTPPFHNFDLFYDPYGIEILQSVNGLLFCSSRYSPGYDRKYYVFNPTTNQFVIIPSVPGGKPVRGSICFMGLAFHQTTCVKYKVVCIRKLTSKHDVYVREKLLQIQTYYSDTREWKISVQSFSARNPKNGSGVYWNGALHWSLIDHSYMFFKFDVEQLHLLPLPVEVISSITLTRYLGESRDHLHLIVYDENEKNLLPLNVYEMAMDHSGWFLKYHVELDQLKELPGSIVIWYLPSLTVIDVIRGAKDEDTVMVLMIHGLFITYNVHDKSFKPISKLNNLHDEYRISLSSNIFHHYSQTSAFL